MLDRLLREPLHRLALPVARAMTRAGVSANSLTVLGTALVAAAAAAIVAGSLALGGWILFAGVLFDVLDGGVARAKMREEGLDGEEPAIDNLGAFLDSTTDRLSDGIVFSALAWHFAQTRPSSPALALTLASGVLAFLTSYIRARAEGLGLECEVGIAERPERMTLVISGLILGLMVPALVILVVLSLVTVVQRFVHVWLQARTPTSL